jgi:hypothetical protein
MAVPANPRPCRLLDLVPVHDEISTIFREVQRAIASTIKTTTNISTVKEGLSLIMT